MKKINLYGVVGWDILAQGVNEALNEANGEDIELEISSPGGSVYESLAIYSHLLNYKGKINAKVVGLVASAATYFILPADEIEVEDNSIFMIHDLSAFAMGSYRDFEKIAENMKRLTNIYVSAYSEKTGKSKANLKQLMQDETFLYGQEIVDAGFANRLVKAGDGAENKDEALTFAQAKLVEVKSMLAKKAYEENELDKIAACLDSLPANKKQFNTPLNFGGDKNKKESVKMDEKELREKNPEILNSIEAEAKKQAIEAERKRVKELEAWTEASPQNAEVAKIVSEAKEEGKTVQEVLAKLIVATQVSAYQGSNPASVQTVNNPDPNDLGAEVLTAEEKEACVALGIKEETYLKNKNSKEVKLGK